MIPLYFPKNSLALFGTINRVQQMPDERQGELLEIKNKDENDVLIVQTVMKLSLQQLATEAGRPDLAHPNRDHRKL